MSETKLVTALFKDRESAERAYKVVTDRGYGPHDVSLAMSHDTRAKHFSHPGMIEDGDTILEDKPKSLDDVTDEEETELGTMAAEGAGIGSAIGGTIGAIAAGLAALGVSLALPGLGIVMAGPIVAALAGAGAGAATGGLVGALVGWGIPEERVKHYESGMHGGGILLAVHAKCDEDAEHFAHWWKHHDGDHVVS